MQSRPEIRSMRNIYFLLSVPLLLGCCTFTKKEEKINVQNVVIPDADHEYFEVENLFINWESILSQNMNTYYVYVYSTACVHCQEMKNWIIETTLNRDDIFFVKGSNKITIKTDVSSTIGATRVEEVAILGYPTLLKIENKTLVKNVAGNSKIMDLLK